LIALLGLLVLAVALLIAPLKLFPIHRALLDLLAEARAIVAELRALRGELPAASGCVLRKP
jgi:hypothetical protein